MKLIALGFLAAVGPSPPARGRGLKRADQGVAGKRGSVAPRTGAWIETRSAMMLCLLPIVAPRTGAWIETLIGSQYLMTKKVAPRTGAWIETF